MRSSIHTELSRRESQIMEILFRLGEGSAEEIREEMPDAPGNASVRVMLRGLEEKGHVCHRREGRRFIYRPTETRERARHSALRSLVDTFFNGSATQAAVAMLSMSKEEVTVEELDALSRLIDEMAEGEQ